MDTHGKKWFIGIFTLLFVLSTLVISCDNSGPADRQNGGILIFIEESGMDSQVLPLGISNTIASYMITGAGPGGARFTADVTGVDRYSRNDLIAGSWTIIVEAYNDDQDPVRIGLGSQSVMITAGTVHEATLVISPITGKGNVHFTITWDDKLTSPSVDFTLTHDSDEEGIRSETFTISDQEQTLSIQDVAEGYYLLEVRVSEGENPIGFTVGTFQVIDGQTTSGTLSTILDDTGDFPLTFSPMMGNPITLTMTGASTTLSPGANMTVTAETSEVVDAYVWYLNGVKLSGELSSAITLGAELTEGEYHLTCVVWKGDIVCSEEILFSVALMSTRRQMASAGDDYTMILKSDGTLWATGNNDSAQFGDGTFISKTTPVQVMTNVASVSAGRSHTMILKSDGKLWATGNNGSGQLGDGTYRSKATPVQVMTDVASVSAGGNHTMILKRDGTLWATGDNRYGQLGDGTTETTATPVQTMSNVASVSSGYRHTMILKEDGSLWATGDNRYGQLGDGTTVSKSTPVQVMTEVKSVASSFGYTMIIKNDGSLWATGRNYYGQLGNDEAHTHEDISSPEKIMNDVSDVAVGNSYSAMHTMILKTDGTLWATGYNEYGQLGYESYYYTPTPTQVMADVASVSVGNNHSVVWKTDGSLWVTGSNDRGQLGDGTSGSVFTPENIMSDVRSVSSGDNHTMILKNDGTLWATGMNYFGQLGDGTNETNSRKSTPVQIMTEVLSVCAGNDQTYIIKEDGSLWFTGRRWTSMGEEENETTPVQVMTGVASVSMGLHHTMALKEDGTLWAKGHNDDGQLGKGSDSYWGNAVFEQIMTDVESVSAGSYYTMFLKKDGTLWATGKNEHSQLGDGTTTTQLSPIQVMSDVQAVSAGTSHTMIIKKNGTLWAVGNNMSGQLGDGTNTNKTIPEQVMTDVLSVSASFYYTHIIKQDGSLWACGQNPHGQLGDGTRYGKETPVQIMTDVAYVSGGYMHTMILKQDGTLWATGENFFGQLGNGNFGCRTSFVEISL